MCPVTHTRAHPDQGFRYRRRSMFPHLRRPSAHPTLVAFVHQVLVPHNGLMCIHIGYFQHSSIPGHSIGFFCLFRTQLHSATLSCIGAPTPAVSRHSSSRAFFRLFRIDWPPTPAAPVHALPAHKFTDQRLFSSRNATTSQKHFSFPIRKMALGDLPDELGSIMDSPVSPVQPNEAQKTSDLAKLAGNKRQQPESSSTPAPNGSCHLVYVRRKLETDHGKTNAASNENTSCSPGVKKSLDTTEAQPEQTGNPKEDHSKNIDEVPSHVDEPQIEILNYWTERFNVLQDHLQYLDKSGSKDYAESKYTSRYGLFRHPLQFCIITMTSLLTITIIKTSPLSLHCNVHQQVCTDSPPCVVCDDNST
ncbi:hypothetical protein KSP40_PGU011109 [Platanthera guangdongensis]|uniref:Uncharacterized protein n=1 Tax=Platanthera guangdongensis TaxID=2320717 RepID=A0ABR2LYR9_9ASPA